MNVLQIALGFLLAIALLAILPIVFRFTLWVVIPLALLAVFSFYVAVGWRQFCQWSRRKKQPEEKKI